MDLNNLWQKSHETIDSVISSYVSARKKHHDVVSIIESFICDTDEWTYEDLNVILTEGDEWSYSFYEVHNCEDVDLHVTSGM